MITTQQIVDVIDTISTIQGASVAINRLIKKELLKKIGMEGMCFIHFNNTSTEMSYFS